MNESRPPLDPISPRHRRFVLSQARVRLLVAAAVVLALVIWLVAIE